MRRVDRRTASTAEADSNFDDAFERRLATLISIGGFGGPVAVSDSPGRENQSTTRGPILTNGIPTNGIPRVHLPSWCSGVGVEALVPAGMAALHVYTVWSES